MKHIIPFICLLMMTSCTWVKDDIDDCPYGFWLQLHYTYNIMDVEAAPRYVKDARIYIYDAEGNYVSRINVPEETLKTNNYRVQVEGLQEGDYQFVVWSGVDNSQYSVSAEMQPLDQFRLALNTQTSSYASELPSLFYGYLSTVHYSSKYATYDIDMMKNTNQLACLVVPESSTVEMNPDDYSLKVVASNKEMDGFNKLVSEDKITYEPFIQESVVINEEGSELHGVKFSVMTLRLMSDSDCRIILENKNTGATIFDISYPAFVGMIGTLYTNLGRELTVQEYLDRQDFHTIIFYLSGDLDQLIQLQVNSWRLRAYQHLKL